MINQLDKVKETINAFLKDLSPKNVAALIYGSFAGMYADNKAAIDVLVIAETNKLTLRSHLKRFNSRRIRFLIVDEKTFERDLEDEWLGGILAENIITPYDPLLNENYLWSQEVKAKKKLINETINNLILGFPEMSKNFLMKPEYFMFEVMMRRAILFPPITYRFLNVTRRDLWERNRSLMMKGFNAAIKELMDEGKLQLIDSEFIKISEDYAAEEKNFSRLTSLLERARIRIVRYALGIIPNIMDSLLDDYKLYRAYFARDNYVEAPIYKLENPKKYIFIPTASGITPFTEKITINEFIRSHMPKTYSFKYDIKRIGGVLNSVYLLKFTKRESEEKVVVKVFKDWYGWKWFPLALWALGTKGFAVLGKSRLEREYSLNIFLSSKGINVPKIICVSPEEKIIFQEYIDGVDASKIIKQLYMGVKNREEELLKIIRKIGCEIAKIHSLGISVGDCKPENIIFASDGRIFFVDLEQADKGGDQAWDIAEFLYYSGHYALFPPTSIVRKVTREFLLGYIESGGRIENIKRALSPRYIKVFSFFTPPHLIAIISSECRKMLKGDITLV
jgi:tRNA A-37 threonylcarbamoyl transferase component Bud32